MENNKTVFTVKETADILCRAVRTIRGHISTGKLIGTKTNTGWEIPEENVRRFFFDNLILFFDRDFLPTEYDIEKWLEDRIKKTLTERKNNA